MSVSKGKSESGFKVVGSGLLGKLAGTEVEQTQKAGKDKLSLLDDEEHRGEGFTEDVVPGVEEGRRTFDFLKRSPEHKRDVDRAGRKQSLGALKQRREEAGGSIFDEDKEGKGYWLEEEPKAAPEKSVSRAQQVATLSEEHDQDEEQYLGGHQDAEQYILRVLEAKGQFLRDNLDPRYERHIQRVLDGKRVSLRRKLGLDEDNDNVSVQGTQGKQDSASTTSVDLLDYRTNHSNGSLDNGTSTKQDRPSEAKSEPKPRSNALAAAIEDAGGSQRDGEHTSSYISRCVHRKREKLYKHIIPSDHSGMHKAERVIDALKNALKQDLSHGKTVADEMVLYSRQQDLRQHLAGYSEEQRNEPIPGDIVTLPERARQAKTSMEGYIEYCKEIELADKEKLMKGLNPDSEAAKFWLRQVLGAKQGILNRQLRGQTSYVDHAVLRRKEKDFKTWCAANDYGWKSWSSEGPISNVEAVEQSETKPPSTEAISARREDGSSETPTSNVEAAEQSEAESSSTEAARDWTTDESSTSPTSNAEVVEQFKTESPPTEAVRDWSTDESSESPTSNAEAAEQSEAKSSSTEAFSGWGKDGSSESPASNTEAVEQPNTESPSTEAVRGRAKEASSETPTSITEAAEQSETKTASAEAVKNTADE